MDKAQIDTLISHWMEATHEVCEDYRVERLESMTDEEVDDQETGCAMAAEDSQDMLRSGNYQDVHGEVRDLLSAASMALDPESPAFTKLSPRISQGAAGSISGGRTAMEWELSGSCTSTSGRSIVNFYVHCYPTRHAYAVLLSGGGLVSQGTCDTATTNASHD